MRCLGWIDVTVAKTVERLATGVLPVLLLVGACGDGARPSLGGTGSYLPLKVGNKWEYQVTDSVGVTRKIQGVTAEMPAGGEGPYRDAMSFRLVSGGIFDDPAGHVSVQAVVDSRVVRFREFQLDAQSGTESPEEFWDPPKLRVDDTPENTRMGAEWQETYREYYPMYRGADAGDPANAGQVPDAADSSDAAIPTIRYIDYWSVEALNEPVSVPAGTFTAMKVKKVQTQPDSDDIDKVKYFWFVRGVGKVKEVGGTQTEELVSYTPAP